MAVIGVTAVYANSIHNGFHFDDGHSIEDNTSLRDLSYLPDYFTDVRTFSPLAENRSYRPLLLVSYALSHAAGGGAPWGYHLGSLLLHALAAAFIGLLCARLLGASGHGPPVQTAAGLAATAVFAVHPLLSETVNYLSARSSMQGAMFSFATVLLYVTARERNRPALLFAALVTLAAGLLSKLTAITAPVLLVAWELLLGPDRLRLRQVGLRTWAQRLLPFFALTVGLTVLHEAIVGPYARSARSIISPWSHLLTQTQVWMRYQALFIWPQDLCADLTMRWSQSPLEGPTARSILFAALLVALSLKLYRKLPVTVFGLIWFYVTLAPTNSIVPLSEPATEHRVYIAMPGLLMATLELVALMAQTRRRQVVLGVVAAATLLALSARTVVRNRVWKNDVTLWGSVLQCAPDNGRAHLNYGRGLLAAGDEAGARQSYARCAELWPNYAFCPINQAALAVRTKQLTEADAYATRALKLQPANVYARYWRGAVDLALERYEAAARAFQGALEVAPGFPDAERGLGLAEFELGKLKEARAHLAPFAQTGRLRADEWYAWGYLLEQEGATPQALKAYNRALAADPDHARARYNRALLHQKARRLTEALADYTYLASAHLPPPDVLFNLVLTAHGLGDPVQARSQRDRLRALYPKYAGLVALDRLLDTQ